MYKRLRTIFALGPVVVAAIVSGCGSEPESGKEAAKPVKAAAAPAKPMGLPVKAAPVTVGAVVDEVTAVGTLLADESVVIRPEIDRRRRSARG